MDMTQEQPVIIKCIPVINNIKKFTILYQGPITWNCVPVSIRNMPSFPIFKDKVLEFLLKYCSYWLSLAALLCSPFYKPGGFLRSPHLTTCFILYSWRFSLVHLSFNQKNNESNKMWNQQTLLISFQQVCSGALNLKLSGFAFEKKSK